MQKVTQIPQTLKPLNPRSPQPETQNPQILSTPKSPKDDAASEFVAVRLAELDALVHRHGLLGVGFRVQGLGVSGLGV